MHITANQVGFYDRPDQPRDQPTYNPPFDAPCPYCGLSITATDVRTVSIMYVGDVHVTDEGEVGGVGNFGGRSYFYRVHSTCHAAARTEERNALDELVFVAVEALPPQEG